ncbi:MAG: wax ester/triacylglycerol synthase family O-acyltransferase, partial [Mycobacteriales bacterium]
MADRLSALDVSFLYLESPTTPMHVGGVAIFDAPESGFDYDALAELVRRRIALVPRYRQKIKFIPGKLGNPVWVDDPAFDVTFHVRRSSLPKPGNEDQLKELVARLQSRALDRTRPLWEMYLIEGLADGRAAILTKTHHAMVDGIAAVDIGTVILDTSPVPRQTPPDDWSPAPEPSAAELVAGSVTNLLRRPGELLNTTRSNLADVRRVAGRAAALAGGVLAAARTTAKAAPPSPLNVDIGAQRRFGMARSELDDYKRIRKTHGGTVNDVVLAVVAGALRAWFLTRGEAVKTTIRAMVPVSVRDESQ